jgi:predicted Kef-type K+ transport protein
MSSTLLIGILLLSPFVGFLINGLIGRKFFGGYLADQ